MIGAEDENSSELKPGQKGTKAQVEKFRREMGSSCQDVEYPIWENQKNGTGKTFSIGKVETVNASDIVCHAAACFC